MDYKPHGVCSQLIKLELDNDIIKHVEFIGGCNGNLKGIASLVTGMKAQDAIERIEGITCGNKPTSCPAGSCIKTGACSIKQPVKNNE